MRMVAASAAASVTVTADGEDMVSKEASLTAVMRILCSLFDTLYPPTRLFLSQAGVSAQPCWDTGLRPWWSGSASLCR